MKKKKKTYFEVVKEYVSDGLGFDVEDFIVIDTPELKTYEEALEAANKVEFGDGNGNVNIAIYESEEETGDLVECWVIKQNYEITI